MMACVTCDRAQWQRKILDNHRELIGQEALVAEAVGDPSVILQDRDYSNRKHFIRRLASGHFLDVVIGYENSDSGMAGTLVTAIVRQRLRRGDPVLYMKRRG